MKVVIAEKPSVAREIASLLGASEKKEGYLMGNGYQVTWAFGHLVTLAMPEDYGISGFQKEVLPILPSPFLLIARKIKTNDGYVPDEAVSKQLKIIEQLLKKCVSIIVATDAGREGELIFRYIYEYLRCNKPFERLWINSLTEKAILKGLNNLKPGKEFDGLYFAAQGRSCADWLVGINASQALTVAAGSEIYSLGRVQTPTLALICKRFIENKAFTTKKYLQIKLEHRKDFIDFKSLSLTKWDDSKQADHALKFIQRHGIATVTALEKKTVNEQPPLLFDLTALQKEANIKLNLSAEETLTIAQSLYEKKFISYPRTGSKYIPEDIWVEIPQLIGILEEMDKFREVVSKIKRGRLNKRIVNDLKVTDHHGLLITDKMPSALAVKEKAIYEMIAYRLLEAVSPVCIKEITDVVLQTVHYDFSLKGCEIIDAGWRFIKGSFIDEDNNPVQDLPELKEGDELKIKGAKVLEKQTKPPVLYTEASLLGEMENAANQIESEQERKALQGIGIGTPATRAAIIETLFKRDYIKREKKSLLPTEKGLKVYELVKDQKIADVAMTAQWEQAMQKIENDELDVEIFQKEIETFTVAITKEILALSVGNEKQPELICPKCGIQKLVIRDKLIKCSDQNCSWVQFRNICGIQLNLENLEKLITTGKTTLLKGMSSRSGKKFDAFIVMNDKAESSFEFEKYKYSKK
ncbi:type IA DNA topoisomerase [Flavobacterium undicola]|uniref:type IA DNA topoisomerase n=1 Tax=Flavobacterium undicola TaxID=1932779 RepID=UPI0013784EDF|nr:type IA DNA topoisomerase [Flavobacterium undicola]MBA0882506.1 topoisomerase C-terminal repeat-containing protein [Flavobacterium undicola]